jgi:hypothetical protein
LLTTTTFAANNPFVGQWKLNASETKFSDRMKVESAGGKKYVFDFGGGPETIVVDGTAQPGISGTVLAVTEEAPRRWTVVRKANGRTLITARWTLSEDGMTLTDDFTQFAGNGSPMAMNYVYAKKNTAAGFAGDWVSSSTGRLTSAYVLRVQPWEKDGLSFVDPQMARTKNVKFDGKDYPNEGANAGATASIRRVDERTLEMTDKVDGRVVDTRQIVVSPDGKTLTMTVHAAGSSDPQILIFDRQ